MVKAVIVLLVGYEVLLKVFFVEDLVQNVVQRQLH